MRVTNVGPGLRRLGRPFCVQSVKLMGARGSRLSP